MAPGGEKSGDFYAVLGLNKECTASDLRIAYKKLALKWHPDRCSASENSKLTEEAKKKFQAIQEAYSVLSDGNKRFMYDVGAYNSDDDENGMGDFLGEMASLMTQTKSSENGKESFEELQDLFEEMFQRDIDAFNSTSHTASSSGSNNNNKRNCPDMSSKVDDLSGFDAQLRNFCLGVESKEGDAREAGGGVMGRRRKGRKQKVSSGHDVSSSHDSRISA